MSKLNKPSIFVSSTCYDLEDIRFSLNDYIDSTGFESILSELDRFPIDPDLNTIENCLNVVREKADIFILIIGERYGSTNAAGKSITKLEFIEACTKGIPKYIFVRKDILNALREWETDKDKDFTGIVDTPKLFEFISELKSSGDIWIKQFETGNDLIKTIKIQLGYLFSDCLALKRKMNPGDKYLIQLGPEALRLAVEKPDKWSWLLFGQLIKDEIKALEMKRLDVELGVSFIEERPIIDDDDIIPFARKKIEWITQVMVTLSESFERGLEKALGEDGNGNLKRILHLTSKYGETYNHLMDWNLYFVGCMADLKYKRLLRLMAGHTMNAIKEMEIFAKKLCQDIEKIIEDINPSNQEETFTLTLKLTVPDPKEIVEEVKRLV